MPDRTVLLADRYSPRERGRRPTILVRSPYGRRGMFGMLFGPVFAERGFNVLIQSCRGTFGSGGDFDPYHHERGDGLATLEWLRGQPWYSGELGTQGPSYLGLCQWAIAADAAPDLKAMAVQVSTHDFRNVAFAGGAFALDFALGWSRSVALQEKSQLGTLAGRFGTGRTLKPAFDHVPLRDADVVATGKPSPFLRDWLDHAEPGDPWWEPITYTRSVEHVTAPVQLLGAWYDPFLPHMIAQYHTLRDRECRVQLIIGPWTHGQPGSLPWVVRESLGWLRAHLLGDDSLVRTSPVLVFQTGADRWLEFSEWPPPHYPERRHLQADQGLSTAEPRMSPPDHFRYDPRDPTPTMGGTSPMLGGGRKDQRRLEERADVLTYTSPPLADALDIAGPVSAELFVRPSSPHTDLFARLCDVDASGHSVNVTDALLRLSPGSPHAEADGTVRVAIDLWPTAHRFLAGHRVRLQVSGGSHPLYSRNPGSGEPLGTATTLQAVDQNVYHDPEHPSAIVLPVLA